MKFWILNEQDYQSFTKNNTNYGFYQSIGWGKLKSIYGWNYSLVGIKDNNDKVIAATLLLSKNTPIKKRIFYAPRGLLVNYHDPNLLNFFVTEIKKYIKNNNGFFLKIDPNVIYQIRDTSGEIIENNPKDDETINNLKKIGFNHFGFNLHFETMQPRWLYRFQLKETYEETFNAFTKSVQKNTIDSLNKGVMIRTGTIDDLPLFKEMIDKSGERNHFITRPLSYYQNLYKCLENDIILYIAYIDTNKYINNINASINTNKAFKEDTLRKMKAEKVGKKLKSDLEKVESSLIKLEKELKNAEELKKNNGDIINIGTLMSLKSNDEYITFVSGMDSNYRNFYPKYAMYNQHIKDSFKKEIKYINFYGISGDFDPKNKYYGIYEMKKGYNGNVIELIGEFDLIVNSGYYYLYKLAFATYKWLKNIRKKS